MSHPISARYTIFDCTGLQLQRQVRDFLSMANLFDIAICLFDIDR
jgi:hypothetical protein